MSPELEEALHEWYDWAIRGSPEDSDFVSTVGLCSNMGWKDPLLELELIGIIQNEFGHLGRGMVNYPFNNGDPDDYVDDVCCENPVRRAWVRNKLGIV